MPVAIGLSTTGEVLPARVAHLYHTWQLVTSKRREPGCLLGEKSYIGPDNFVIQTADSGVRAMAWVVGVDVGGTFTDFYAVDTASGAYVM